MSRATIPRHVRGAPAQWAATERILTSLAGATDQLQHRQRATAADLAEERLKLTALALQTKRLIRALVRIALEVDGRAKGER
ncbi:MAG: hypothetical protein H0X38_05660 [Planctomycetes bacterium]|nr:hypothetical protein [Planctomycetota bacterium]